MDQLCKNQIHRFYQHAKRGITFGPIKKNLVFLTSKYLKTKAMIPQHPGKEKKKKKNFKSKIFFFLKKKKKWENDV